MILQRNPGLTAINAKIFLATTQCVSIIAVHNTPQAYPVVRYRDAQTGGLIVSGGLCAL